MGPRKNGGEQENHQATEEEERPISNPFASSRCSEGFLDQPERTDHDLPAGLPQHKVNEYRDKFANPYVAAERGYIDEVMVPHETRPKLIRAFQFLESKVDANPKKKHGNIPL